MILALATIHACWPFAMVSSMSVDSHVKPSPKVCHSTPRWSANFLSPVCHFPLLMNCTTTTRHPRAHARPMTPKAADDFPFPLPVFTITIDSARTKLVGTAGASRCSSGMVSFRMHTARHHHEFAVFGAKNANLSAEVTIEGPLF